jgi:zinc protease
MNDQKSLKIFHERFADASGFTFLFVGNFKTDSLKNLVETYLAGLPALNRHEHWLDKTYRYPPGIIKKKVYKGKEQKSQTSIVITGSFTWDRRNRYICSMLEMLQIKLREKLREDLGGTYSITANSSFTHHPLERYRLTFSFGCDPQRADELSDVIFTQIDSLKNFGMKDNYLSKVKEIQLREYETDVKKNNFWISNLEFKVFHQEQIADILTYPEMVKNLSMDEVQQAAREFLNLDNYIKIVLYPEND